MTSKKKDFLSSFVEYLEDTEVPEEFALWCGVAGVGCALGRNIFLDMSAFKVFPNEYIVLIAGSGRCRKSTAINAVTDLCWELDPLPNMISQKLTAEALIDAIRVKSDETGKIKSSAGIARLTRHGWMPTISLLPQPYGEMVRIIESANDMDKVNEFAVQAFDGNVLDSILARWQGASLLAKRRGVLAAAIEAYKASNYIAAVYVMLPQIEGLTTAHIKRRCFIFEEANDWPTSGQGGIH